MVSKRQECAARQSFTGILFPPTNFLGRNATMTARWTRFVFEAAKRMVGLLLLLCLFVSQSVIYAEAAPDSGAHGHHQVHAAHDAACPMAAPALSAATPSDPCPDHAAMAHCSVAPCCFHSTDGLAKAEFNAVLMAQNHRFKDDGAVFSRTSSPRDRPPRLV